MVYSDELLEYGDESEKEWKESLLSVQCPAEGSWRACDFVTSFEGWLLDSSLSVGVVPYLPHAIGTYGVQNERPGVENTIQR